MKANMFVKKHGWDAVVKAVKSTTSEETAYFESKGVDPILSKDGSYVGFNVKIHCIKYDEVKRLVESHEFVVANGGLDGAKEYCDLHDPNRRSKHYNSLRNKIADVESCQ